MPENSDEETFTWSRFSYSKDYGKTWEHASRIAGSKNAAAFSQGMLIKYVSGKNSDGDADSDSDSVSMEYVNINESLNIPYSERDDETQFIGKHEIERGGLEYKLKTKKTIAKKHVNDALVNVSTNFDSEFLANVKTPSGWTKLRCDNLQSNEKNGAAPWLKKSQ